MPGKHDKYYFENDKSLKLTFALEEFTHSFDVSDKPAKN